MAKKQIQVIELDVITRGLDTAETSFSKLTDNTGELGKKSKEILKDISKAKAIMNEYGDEMPIDKAKELQKLLEKIGGSADDISQMETIKIFGDKEIEKIKKINSQIAEYNKKIEQQNKLQAEALAKRNERVEQLKSQKTANLTQEDGTKKTVKLDSIKDKWNSKSDLQNIVNSKSSSAEQVEAAKAVLEQLTKAEEQYSRILTETETKIKKYEGAQADLRAAKAELNTTTRELTDAEKLAGESTAMFAQSQASQLNKVIEANQKLGNSAIDTSNKLNKQQASLGGVVKSLFSWTAAWNIGRKLYKEAIKTITEMDKALTGMAMVTGKTREEVDGLIPRIQSLSKETSTAMTEIAGLITEYTKQGRTLEESFILAEETAKAAKIAGISAAESIQYMTSAINGFNLAAKDATRVSDIFANLAAISATDYEQLAISLSKVSAQANTAGMSIEYTTALLAKGIETTQEAPESIGTALKTILARMRELSDYGKTLEDGGSVNKVENALAAAGIELRDVNGQFRDLEQIFNELGPKWDSLNTMQQQAIAQAVAGTRQQSRFVAIMQDWERTQELAAEAQDSAGASAAQYAIYAEGMEAAMTNIKTAWQEFTQSLTSSKIIIGLVNGITKALENITNFLESGGKSTKVIFMIITAIVAANKMLTPLKKALGMETDKEKMLELQKLEILKKQAEANERLLKQEHEKKKASAEALQKEIEAQEKLISSAMKDKDRAEWEAQMGSEEPLTDEELAKDPEVANIQAKIDGLQKELELKQGALKQANEDLASSARSIEEAETKTKQASEDYKTALEQSNHPMIQRLNMLIKELDLEREKVRLAQKETKDQKKLNKLKEKEQALSKRINQLEQKKQKIVNKTQGLFSRIGNVLSTSIESSLRSMLSTLGPIGDILGTIISSVIEWGVQLISQLPLHKLITKEKQKQTVEEKKETATKAVQQAQDATEIVADTTDLKIEEQETKEEEKETGAKVVQKALDTQEIVSDTTDLALDKKETQEEEKQSGVKLINALFGMAGSASQMGPVGWIIAAAILAMAGIAVGVSAASAASATGTVGAASDKQLESGLAKKQNANYQLKKTNSDLSGKIEDIAEIDKKQYISEEDKKQRAELIENLRGSNEAWKNLSDDQVLQEAKKSVQRNTDQIKNNIDANYELVLQMENLTSALAKQAIVDKMKKDQTNMSVGPNGDIELARQYASNMAEIYADQNAETLSDSLKSAEYGNWDAIVDTADAALEFGGLGAVGNTLQAINTWASGDGFWAGVDDLFLGGAVGEISDAWNDDSKTFWEKLGQTAGSVFDAAAAYIPGLNFVDGWLGLADVGFKKIENAEALREQEAADAAIKLANQEIMDFAGRMSEAGTDVYDQLLKYGEIINDFNDITQAVAAEQFSTVDLLYDITNGSEQTATNLKLLADAGLLTADSLVALTDGLINTTKEVQSSLSQGLELYNNGVTVGNEYASIESLTTDLGLEIGASLDDITAAYLKKYAKYNSDGTLKINEETGLTDMKSGGSAEIYDQLLEMQSNMGDYASYTKSQLEVLQSLQGDVDISTLAQDFIDNTAKLIGLETEDDVKAFNADIEKQKEAAKTIYAEGMKMIDESLASQKQFIDQKQSELESLREQYSKTTDSEKKAEIQQAITDINEVLGPVTNEYQKSLTTLTDATLQAAGYISAATLDEKMKGYESTQSKLNDLLSKLSEGSYNSEDLKYIREDLAPIFESMFRDRGEEFDLDKFYDSFINQTDYAYIALNDLFKYTGKELNNEILTSIATTEAHIAEFKSNLDNYDENGELTDDARAQLDQWENELSTAKMELSLIDDLIKNEIKLYDLRKTNHEARIDSLKKEENGILHYYSTIQKENRTWEGIVAKAYDDEISRLANSTLKSLGLTKEQLKQYLQFTNGKIHIDEDWYNFLSETNKKLLHDNLDTLQTYAEDWQSALDAIQEDVESFYNYQIDQQNELLDAYKSKLEEEQESLQNSLDKRKEMYEKYFDSLDNESEDENFEEEQARLQKAISSLSSATDATSLEKLKSYQQALTELEEEHLQTERDRRRDATMETLDNQSEYVDQYYEDRLENEQQLWEEISAMSETEIQSLMTTYNEEYKNTTDLNKQYMLLSYKELHANIMSMMGNTEAANKAQADYENYKKYLEAYLDNPSIGKYDSAKKYSKGGLVDYTGLAMVHGSSTRPEAFLNASQTAIFTQLAQGLENYYNRPSSVITNSDRDNESSVTIENFTIAVDATLTDNNVQQTGESLAEALLNGLRRTGVSVNMKK